VIAIHVRGDAGRGIGQRIRERGLVAGRLDPVHRPEAADEVDVGEVEAPESEILEVDPVDRVRMAGQVGTARGAPPRLSRTARPMKVFDSAAGLRAPPARSAGCGDHFQVLRVHGETADEQQGAPRVRRVGMTGEWMTGVTA
jgi:hypothetical protein